MQPTEIDTLLLCRWLIPVIPEDQVWENQAVAIDGGRIVAIGTEAEIQRLYTPRQTIPLDRHLVIPGLINSHCQTATRLLRGHGEHQLSESWLQRYYQPSDSRFINPEFVANSASLAMAEMIKTGTTCFADLYFAQDSLVDAIRASGLRSQISFVVSNTATAHANSADDYIHSGLKLQDSIGDHPLIKVACAPHGFNELTDDIAKRVAIYRDELDMAVHLPCHQSSAEITQSTNHHGCRPLQRLNSLGLLAPHTQLAHMHQLNAEDIKLLESTNSHVVRCPNPTVNDEYPADQLIDQGINVALGSEGGSLHHLNHLQTLSHVATTDTADAVDHRCHRALRMATINGARTLGWEEQIGSIEAGKYADIIALEIDPILQQPLYNSPVQLLGNAQGHQVSHSWVAGKPLMRDRQLLTLDAQNLSNLATNWRP